MNRPLVVITLVYISIILLSSCIDSIVPGKSKAETSDIKIELAGTVVTEPCMSDSSVSFELAASAVKTGKNYRKYSGSFMVFAPSSECGVRYGDVIRAKGFYSSGKRPSNPGEFDYGKYLEMSGLKGVVTVPPGKKSGLKVLKRGQGNPFIGACIDLKNRIIAVHKGSMPEPYASLFGSIIFGLRASPIPDSIRESYQKSGVVHILVASGQQVSILIGVCLMLGRSLRAPALAIAAVTSLFTWAFACMAGMGASIFRSALMGQVLIASMLFERETDFYSSFSLAALVLLLMDPDNLFNIGFQLSFLATWSLVYLAPMIKDLLSAKLPPAISSAVSIAAAPVIVTTPVSLYYFSQLSFVALVSNMIVVPAAETLTTLGFISSAAGLVLPFAAAVIDGFILVVMIVLNSLIEFFASIPGAFANMKQPHWIFILGYYASIIYVAEKLKRKELAGMLRRYKRQGLYLSVFILAAVLLSPVVFAGRNFKMTVIDVGQGDSILLEMPDGRNVLVDGGGKPRGGEKVGAKVVVPFLTKKGINKLDMVVLTHPHDDHVAGLVPVLKRFRADTVLDSGFAHPSKPYYDFLKLVQSKKIKYRVAAAGQVFDFGKARMKVLAPVSLIKGTESDANNNSIVLKIIYGKTTFLLMGDAAFEEEEEILASGANVKSDVLKVGHHGSSTSSGYDFLSAVRPKYAFISVGARNRYGHPTRAALERLKEIGAKILRTDTSGAIITESDGKTIKITTVK